MHGNYLGLVLAGAMVLGVREQQMCAKSAQNVGCVTYLYLQTPAPVNRRRSRCQFVGGTEQLSVRLEAAKLITERYLVALFCLMADPLPGWHPSYASAKQSSMPSAEFESGLSPGSGVKARCR